MANQTLLASVNAVMKKLGLIKGDSGALATLTDAARQTGIDQIVQVINEGVAELYSEIGLELPTELLEGTLTLATNDRDYDPDDVFSTQVNTIRFPFQDQTNGQFIYEFRAGYRALVNAQLIPANYTGLPQAACIRDTDGFIYLDRLPTAAENGRTYTVWADKSLRMTVAADTVPFKDEVFDAMVPVWVALWERRHRNRSDDGEIRVSLGRAGRLMRQKPPRTDYNPRPPVGAFGGGIPGI